MPIFEALLNPGGVKQSFLYTDLGPNPADPNPPRYNAAR